MQFSKQSRILICFKPVERCTHFSRYYRMHRGPAVAHHEYVLGVREQQLQVVHELKRQRVLVAQTGCRHSVSSDHFEDKRSNGRVDHILGHAGLFQPQRLFGRLVPMAAHLQDPRNHPRLLSTPVERKVQIKLKVKSKSRYTVLRNPGV